MKTKRLLFFYLSIMFALILCGLIFPEEFTALLKHPEFYIHAKFIHILCVTLFFANAVIGMIWETRSLLSNDLNAVRYTYQTVVWLDAIFTAPLIIISVMTGIMMGTILGGIWSIGWLSIAFTLFLLSGLVWVLADIPTQYQVKREFKSIPDDVREIPDRLRRLLWRRAGISFLGTAPLLVIFYLMVHKPALPKVSELF